MARFRYRMQNILNIREKQEEQQRAALGLAMARLNDEQDKLDDLNRRQTAYREEGRALLLDTISPYDILTNRNEVRAMDELIAGQKLVVMRAEQTVEVERQRLYTAIQERRIQERLREKAYERFLREERAAETKENDERVSFVYGQGADKRD